VIITKLQVAPVELDVSSQSSSSCRARRVERVELCCSTSSTQPKCISSTRRTCRDESSRAKWNLAYKLCANNTSLHRLTYVDISHPQAQSCRQRLGRGREGSNTETSLGQSAGLSLWRGFTPNVGSRQEKR